MGIQNIMIRDESMGGKTLHEFSLSFPKAEVTVSDIIRERVRYEVEAYNRKAHDKFFGLVRPTGAEQALNGYTLGYEYQLLKINPAGRGLTKANPDFRHLYAKEISIKFN